MKSYFKSISPNSILIGMTITVIIVFTTMIVTSEASSKTATSVLTNKLEMGVVELNVSNMEAMKKYYMELAGLEILDETKDVVTLGYQDREIMRFFHTPELSPAPLNSAGLYHTAIVFESRSTLAAAIKRLRATVPHLYQGTADHLVSEAFYFADPEGNGVEIYYDKDPSTWQWNDGEVVMGSEFIDPDQYIATYGTNESNKAKKVGHVHLKIGDEGQAKAFYKDIVGLHVTAERPSALFVSDGKYHHNLGMNTWESLGAGKRTKTLGLKSYELLLENKNDLKELKDRLSQGSIPFKESGETLTFEDPWGTVIVVNSQTR